MEMVYITMVMGLDTKGNSMNILDKVRDSFILKMVLFIKVNFIRIKCTEMLNLFIQMVLLKNVVLKMMNLFMSKIND